MRSPDYSHNIATLMHGIAAYLNATPIPPGPLAALHLGGARRLAFLIIDGLGAEFLARHPDSFLARHSRATIDSVFPSTTASAMTTYLTGEPPARHAVTGWHTWLREIGCLTTVLPFVPRFGGASLSAAGIHPEDMLGAGPLFDRLDLPSELIYPHYIVGSENTRATTGKATTHGYHDLSELFATLRGLSHQSGPHYLFAYWAQLDTLSHQFGPRSLEVEGHFRLLDAACAEQLPLLAAAGYDVLVCADHGFTETDPDHTIHLEEDHPELAAMLTVPLCGEPRTAFAYVRAHRREAFEAYVHEHLAEACELRVSEELIEEGWFGPPPRDPRLVERVGDYTLLMKGRWVIRDRLLNEKPFRQVGVHGGVSEAELRIPLIHLPAL